MATESFQCVDSFDSIPIPSLSRAPLSWPGSSMKALFFTLCLIEVCFDEY